jgi:hypothetical protein
MSNNFFLENRAFCGEMWNSILEARKPQMTIWRMPIECWISKATHIHTHTHTLRVCHIYCYSNAKTMPLT